MAFPLNVLWWRGRWSCRGESLLEKCSRDILWKVRVNKSDFSKLRRTSHLYIYPNRGSRTDEYEHIQLNIIPCIAGYTLCCWISSKYTLNSWTSFTSGIQALRCKNSYYWPTYFNLPIKQETCSKTVKRKFNPLHPNNKTVKRLRFWCTLWWFAH